MESLVVSVEQVLELTGAPITAVKAVGLDMPGPARGDGVISSKAPPTSVTSAGAASTSAAP